MSFDAERPPASSPPDACWRDDLTPDPTLLFRYSALTMNSHRIHYDRPYAMSDEGYPALVVQGPLQATLLINLAERHLPDPITGFAFRGTRPAFCGAALHICGEAKGTGASIRAEQGGATTMVATASCGSL